MESEKKDLKCEGELEKSAKTSKQDLKGKGELEESAKTSKQDLKGEGEREESAKTSKQERRRRAKQRRREKPKEKECHGENAKLIEFFTSMLEAVDKDYIPKSIDGIPELKHRLKMIKCFKRHYKHNILEEMKSFSGFFSEINMTLFEAFDDAVTLNEVKGKIKGKKVGFWLYDGDDKDTDDFQSMVEKWGELLCSSVSIREQWDKTFEAWITVTDELENSVNRLENATKEWNKVIDMSALLKGKRSKNKKLNKWKKKCWGQLKDFSKIFEFCAIGIKNSILNFFIAGCSIDLQEIPNALENSFEQKKISVLVDVYKVALDKGTMFSNAVRDLTHQFFNSIEIISNVAIVIKAIITVGNLILLDSTKS